MRAVLKLKVINRQGKTASQVREDLEKIAQKYLAEKESSQDLSLELVEVVVSA